MVWKCKLHALLGPKLLRLGPPSHQRGGGWPHKLSEEPLTWDARPYDRSGQSSGSVNRTRVDRISSRLPDRPVMAGLVKELKISQGWPRSPN